MKTVAFTRYGSPDDLRLDEAPIPTPCENEALIKIYASSVNSWDWELLHATPFANRVFFGLLRPKRLKTLGIDVAGRIEAVGNKVQQWRVGDEVYGDLSACGWGGFAEYVAVPEDVLTRKPPNLTFEQAAAVPQAGLLALQGLVDKGHIRSGMKVLVNGASGGSGSFAVQIAKTYGVEITGVCRTSKMEFVRDLGADHVIDYTREDFTRSGVQYDLIVDAQARHSILDYRRALRPHGVYVLHGGATSSINQIMFLGPFMSLFGSRKLGILMHKANKGLDQMSELLGSDQVVPIIDKTFPLTEVVDALRYYGEGHVCGKVVISVERNAGSSLIKNSR